MALLLKKVRWKNLLSTGNVFTEIDLTSKKTTLIVGINGSGKSTVLEALCFCLYKKAFRNINLPQLVNSITQKGLLVEVELSMNGKEYLIRRGIKPAIFEIFQDGVLVNQNAETKDYQEYLETNILRMNFRSFKQIVVLGSADFVPFMQLPAQGRREVIEDLLDLQIFSVMNTLLKGRVEENRQAIAEVEKNIILTTNMLELHEKHMVELRRSKEDVIEVKQKKIEELINSNSLVLLEVQGMQSTVETLQQELGKLEKYVKKVADFESITAKVQQKIKAINADIRFYNDEHLKTCPTCKQTVTEEFKCETIAAKKAEKASIQESYDSTLAKMKKIEDKVTESKITAEQISKFNKAIMVRNAEINATAKLIETIQEEIQELQNSVIKTEENNVDGSELRTKLAELRVKKQELSNEREILSIAGSLLKDGGIKSLVIKQHIPIINKYINKHLQMMKFHVDFHFDENFKETIRSRYRDEFSYESFSQGEKMRINLAILFAWRAIAKMRNSASTNLLMFDEIFDSSLDDKGIEEFIKILESLTNDTNTFIISHKASHLIEKFDSVISFTKVKNFSKIGKLAA